MAGDRDEDKEERLRRFRTVGSSYISAWGCCGGDATFNFSLLAPLYLFLMQNYSFENWAAHRSTRRYLRHFLGIFSSRIVSGLRWPLGLVALEATAVCLYEAFLKQGLLPAGFKSIQVKVRLRGERASCRICWLCITVGIRLQRTVCQQMV